MNTTATLKNIALITTAALPAAIAAEAFGVSLPAPISVPYAFGAFVVALMFLTFSADYREATILTVDEVCGETASKHSVLALAA